MIAIGRYFWSTVVAISVSVIPACSERVAKRQETTAKNLGVSKELTLDLGESVTMKLVLIPAGKFTMGSLAKESGRDEDEGPQHEVTITQPFYMGIYEVTQQQYQTLMWMRRMNGEFFEGPSLPKERVSWGDAMDFCDKLSLKTGKKVSLPTEAQWEYACRAGTRSPFNTGETIDRRQANISSEGDGFWPLLTVGSFQPNAFGLYDMHGNSTEWCSDFYDEKYYREAEADDPTGPPTVEELRHVIRGGCRGCSPSACRSAYRRLSGSGWDSGFRVVVAVADKSDHAEGMPNPSDSARRILADAKLIHESDERQFKKTLTELAALGPAAKPAILSAVNDADSRTRQCAVAALSYLADAGDVAVLIDLLAQKDLKDEIVWIPSQLHVQLAFRMIGSAAVEPLIAALKHRDAVVRRAVIDILYDIDPQAAADSVLECGAMDEDKDVRYEALAAVLAHGDQRALDPLLAAIESDLVNAKVDMDGCHAEWCWALVTAFTFGGQRGADLFVSALDAGKVTVWEIPENGPRDPRLVPHLIKGLDSKEGCVPVVSWRLLRAYENDPRAVAALTARGWEKESTLENESVDSLLEKLHCADESEVAYAAQALGTRREKRAVSQLLEMISRQHKGDPHAAIIALGKIADQTAVSPLTRYLASEPANNNSNWDLRRPAIEALGELRAKEAIESLITIANDADSYGADEAVYALLKIGDERGLTVVDKVFRTSSDVFLRERAWQALQASKALNRPNENEIRKSLRLQRD